MYYKFYDTAATKEFPLDWDYLLDNPGIYEQQNESHTWLSLGEGVVVAVEGANHNPQYTHWGTNVGRPSHGFAKKKYRKADKSITLSNVRD